MEKSKFRKHNSYAIGVDQIYLTYLTDNLHHPN